MRLSQKTSYLNVSGERSRTREIPVLAKPLLHCVVPFRRPLMKHQRREVMKPHAYVLVTPRSVDHGQLWHNYHRIQFRTDGSQSRSVISSVCVVWGLAPFLSQ
jgi:hypothetical protein